MFPETTWKSEDPNKNRIKKWFRLTVHYVTKKLRIRKHLGVRIWWVLMDASLTRDEQETIDSRHFVFLTDSPIIPILIIIFIDFGQKWLFKYLWIYSIIHFIFIGKTSTDLEAGQEKRETSELLIFLILFLVMRVQRHYII